jgi:hypothetical protein
VSHQAQVPILVAAYFGGHYDGGFAYTRHPIITQEFHPGRGWVTTNYRKRVSVAWLRKLKAQGVTGVALTCDGRRADFTITEILRASRKGTGRG